MPLITKTGPRRTLIALSAFAAVSAMIAAPAAADHGHRGRSHYPRVGVYVGIPPIVLVAGAVAPYYGGPYARGYDRREYAYEAGYEDGYDDRAREEWRRRHRGHHHHHDDCDD
jgi:hypothetical protein